LQMDCKGFGRCCKESVHEFFLIWLSVEASTQEKHAAPADENPDESRLATASAPCVSLRVCDAAHGRAQTAGSVC